ncbi:S-layer homology domain-containing protein [Paenibacillus eucommiae]|uniref:SLH domain-containing protein n=1 Tax=Paenibacillus eucommiae TaxID=1355755 RepID=A0ABS4J854_9BACL|nr:S-layer homology domain-containing protein [Paenibacillus eucommiae]MBP1996017.1 hypothetical protein [Paenibacillus eucommiae]
MKIIKKAGTAVIASAMLFSVAPQAWADEAIPSYSSQSSTSVGKAVPPQEDLKLEAKISKEKALELAKTYITIPEGYVLESVHMNSYRAYLGKETPTWNMNFTKKVKDRNYGNISITIDGTSGKLLGYSSYDNDPDRKPSYPPKVDYQGAKAAAAEWIAKINPTEQNQVQYNDRDEKSFRPPLSGSYQYNIRYDRVVNGVAFPENGISISVDGDGKITGYNYNWDDTLKFEKQDVISKEKAAQAFRDTSNISLSYQIPYEARGERKPLTVYSMSNNLIDAVTGEPWNRGYSVSEEEAAKPLTDKPIGQKPTGNLNLTKEQAIAKVNESVKLPAGIKLEDASFYENTNPETGEVTSSWNLRWNQPPAENDKTGKMGAFISATVNSRTGELSGYNRYLNNNNYDKDVDAKVSLEDAKTKAIEFVKKNLPAYTDQLVLGSVPNKSIPLDQLKKMQNWDMNFQRVIDGVNAGNESVNISIDRTTGEVVNYYAYLSETAYPQQKPEVLPLEEAKDLLMSQYDIQLSYITVNENAYANSGGISAEKYNLMVAAGEIMPPVSGDGAAVTTKLVYALVPKNTQDNFFLDAVTGEWKEASTGDVISIEKLTVTDIDNHWARNELQLMVDYRAIDVVDGKVSPNKIITRGEMIKMLVIAMNGGRYGIYYAADREASFKDVSNSSPYFAYVENAVDRGLIDPGTDFNPTATMNREEMAQLVVRALGYKDLAKYEDIFNDKFADAAKLKSRGEAAIVVGLGIMTLTNGSFNPAENVTRAQASAAFFRYLQKRTDLQGSGRYF